MKLLNLAILKLLLYLVAGIIAGYLLPGLLPPFALLYGIGLLSSLSALSYLLNFRTSFELLCILLFVTLGYTGPSRVLTHSDNLASQTNGQTLLLHLHLQKKLNPTDHYQRYEARVTNLAGTSSAVQMLVRVSRQESPLPILEPGRSYTAIARLKAPAPPSSPSGFNYSSYLKKKGILQVADIHTRSIRPVQQAPGFHNRLFQARRHLEKALDRTALSPFTKGLTGALVLGDRTHLDPDFYNTLKATGGAHLIALSGLHTGILTALLSFLFWPLRKLRGGRPIHLFIVIAALIIYILLTGASSSVVRAGVMFIFLSVSLLLESRLTPINGLVLSAFILLLVNPFYLFDVGFQLSYAALTGILIMNPLYRSLWNPGNKVLRYLWGLVTISVSAQLFTFPLTLYYFQQLPVTFLLTNLILTPLVIVFLVLAYLLVIITVSGWSPPLFCSLMDTFGTLLNTSARLLDFDLLIVLSPVRNSMLMTITFYILIAAITASLFHYRSIRYIPLALLCIQGGCIRQQLGQPVSGITIHHRYRETLITLTQNGRSTKYRYNHLSRKKGTTPTKPEEILMLAESPPYFVSSGRNHLLIIDHKQVNLPPMTGAVSVLLINSARVNLDRVIEHLHPASVIADGSNYPNLVQLWAKTCRKKNIPFHYTGEKGYYMLFDAKP